jgi:hypothetical protein
MKKFNKNIEARKSERSLNQVDEKVMNARQFIAAHSKRGS